MSGSTDGRWIWTLKPNDVIPLSYSAWLTTGPGSDYKPVTVTDVYSGDIRIPGQLDRYTREKGPVRQIKLKGELGVRFFDMRGQVINDNHMEGTFTEALSWARDDTNTGIWTADK